MRPRFLEKEAFSIPLEPSSVFGFRPRGLAALKGALFEESETFKKAAICGQQSVFALHDELGNKNAQRALTCRCKNDEIAQRLIETTKYIENVSKNDSADSRLILMTR
ncbi:hypothetical protein WR25_23813 [Diploscapter pachys]|uniref:Uncharacterized protein n=1 Tax=Diploscapter pachys TaxID=2018661 RepID=A0A2A2J8C2_9BILA|nr:hypothetical protein WR25_23813 [Diploscapter pachys]